MSPITPAASVLLTHAPGSPEIFLVRRAEQLRFFGGFWAFPGGKAAALDAETPVLSGVGLSTQHRQRLVRAARELFEETGVLVARQTDGSFLPTSTELEQLRREMMSDRLSFAAILDYLRLSLHADDFRPIGDITTPPFVAMRFDTTFFVVYLPPQQRAEVWTGELVEGRWASAAAMLGQWLRGDCLLSPPTVMTLQAVQGRAADEAPVRLGPLFQALAGGALHPIYFAPAVQLIPLHTVALPPSSYTNAYLVGTEPLYLLDPGPNDDAERQRLFDILDSHARAGRRLSAVVLTHHHPDHVGAAAVCAERYRVPIWAHPWTAAALRGRIDVHRHIHDGDHLDLGPCPDGNGRWHLEAIHTPGHAPGHLAFYEPRYRLLFTGDMVSTLTSIVIVPPEGDLTVYLESLKRLQTYDCRLLLPAHGNASSRPQETLLECLEHRVKREEQLLAALSEEPHSIAELAPELYKGVPASVMQLAQLQMLAGLQKLQREGRVEAVGEGIEATWRLRPPT